MSEMKPTPGPWTFYTEPQPNGCPIVGNSKGLMVAMVAHSVNYQDQKESALSDARLIAEAGTVFHTTGLSPVQLVEQKKELLSALLALDLRLRHCFDLAMDASEVYDSFYQDIVRAAVAGCVALAKCEGVKP